MERDNNKANDAVRNMVALKLLKSFLKDKNAYNIFIRNKCVYPQKNDMGYICGIVYVHEVKYFRVMCYGKYNYINVDDGSMFNEVWYDKCVLLDNGILVLRVSLNGFKFLKNGKKINDICFSDYTNFFNGVASVQPINSNKWIYIKENGELLTDMEFDKTNPFYHFSKYDGDFAVVENDGKMNLLNINGNLIGDVWYQLCTDFDDFGYSLVKLNDKYNFLKKNGKYLLTAWFDKLKGFDGNGIASGIYHGNEYIINLRDKSIKIVK